jgi:hypothetical protein
MAHKGTEKSNLPRIAFEISKELKKKYEHFLIENGRSTKEIMTDIVEKLVAGKLKL